MNSETLSWKTIVNDLLKKAVIIQKKKKTLEKKNDFIACK